MRGLLNLFAMLCLFAGLANGSFLHAAELASEAEVHSASQWLSEAEIVDELPSDSDRGYPHHHSICHCHNLPAPIGYGAPAVFERMAAQSPAPDFMLAPAPPGSLLRPPIA